MKISVVDVETANSSRSSICGIGIVQIEGQSILDVFDSLVNPRVEFEPQNVRIHHISEEMVEGERSFAEIATELRSILEFGVVASHSPFDRGSLEKAYAEAGLDSLAEVHWLDTCRLAKRAWPGRAGKGGYGLAPLARSFGWSFSHHVAIDDARTAARVLKRAMSKLDWSILDCLELMSPHRANQRAGRTPVSVTELVPNPEGAHFGKAAVFTGGLSMTRAEAATVASASGYRVLSQVNRSTALLVIGTQATDKESSKQRRAEELNRTGRANISMVSEEDFLKLAKSL